ncbi:MAG: hypothetical protein KF855_09085 [Acidobacteria bacterium]|nr:hypothetical protein [Acidobacteriota bacterium]
MKETTILLILLLVFGSLTAHAQQRRTGPRTVKGPPPAPKPETKTIDDPLGAFAEKETLPKEHVFAAVDSAGRAAEMILENDENSLPALIGSLQFAGFHIIDKDQKILFAPRWGYNGMAFYNFEVAGMLRASQLGMASSVAKFGNALADGIPQMKGLGLPNKIFDALKDARTKGDHENRFLANLIFELSRNKPLVSAETPISALQFLLIERRFLGDLIDAYEESAQFRQFGYPGKRLFQKQPENVFVKASFAQDADPCKTLEEIDKIIGHIGKGNKVKKFLVDGRGIPLPKDIFKEAAGRIELINTIWSYVNLILANISIKVDVKVPEPLPYVRTKSNTRNGEGEKILTASFKRSVPGSKMVNCASKALKILSGLDIQAADDGPLIDLPVSWEPIEEKGGFNRHGNAAFMVDPEPNDHVNGINKQRTDQNGETKVKVYGWKQSKDLTKMAVFEDPKKLRLRISIATERMDGEKDIQKLFFTSLGLKGAGVLGIVEMIIDVVPDMMGKMQLKKVIATLPAKDWIPCTDDDNWGGTVTYTRDKWTPTVNIHEEVTVRLLARAEGEPKSDKPNAYYDVFGYRTVDNPIRSQTDDCCTGTHTSQSGSKREFEGSFTAPFNISFRGSDNVFSLGFSFGTPSIRSKDRSYLKVLSTACPYDNDDGYDKTGDGSVTLSATLTDGHYPTRYVDAGGEHLIGETSYMDSDGATIKWDWNLTHCRPKKQP